MQLTQLVLTLASKPCCHQLLLVACYSIDHSCLDSLLLDFGLILRHGSLQVFHSPLLELLHADYVRLVYGDDQCLEDGFLLVSELLLKLFISNQLVISYF